MRPGTLIAAALLLAIAAAATAGFAAGERAPDSDERRAQMLGLRTVIYHVDDLEAAREWYARAFGVEPYFEEPFYVGFDVGGYELGLSPAGDGRSAARGGVDAYWGVEDIEAAHRRLLDHGAEPLEEIRDVGDGIRTATVGDPFGNPIGIVENPHFEGDAVP